MGMVMSEAAMTSLEQEGHLLFVQMLQNCANMAASSHTP